MAFILGAPLVLIGILLPMRREPLPRRFSILFLGVFGVQGVLTAMGWHELVATLHAAHVPAIYIEYPETDHGFDFATVFPKSDGVHVPIDSQFAPPTDLRYTIWTGSWD